MKKKIMMLLLATAMVITVAGCSAEDIDGAVGTLNSVGQNIIEENADSFQELSDEFKKGLRSSARSQPLHSRVARAGAKRNGAACHNMP